ncbi:hypothetical protein J4E93_001027 [Alternaria ventricosa]|uniref:uncharacterized protein n=1 Tax=Alternaria ventricosa TaxID=1187951 RepID=UPI0020C57EAA|nr:uncharacterized protein J4E93_001027 [Alternaria ventricosa]KAI4656308.1 hypothetical protein J4E93_001027 [Alternaria ventricosa]
MRFSTIAATALCLVYNAMAISLPEREVAALPISEEEAQSSNDLAKRLSIEEQVAILGAGAVVALNVNAIATYVSNLMKAQSDANTCGVISGTVDGVNYQYHAATTGKNCDTTAEVKTMKDAVSRGLEFMSTHNINQACFNMQHGGTWRGLLQLASGDRQIINGKCDSVTYTLTVT